MWCCVTSPLRAWQGIQVFSSVFCGVFTPKFMKKFLEIPF
ncbi:DUF3649 domain-containing protein [Capnocytophaga cynodegmi]